MDSAKTKEVTGTPQGLGADSSLTEKELHVATDCRGELAPQGVDRDQGEARDGKRQRDDKRLLSSSRGLR